MIVRLKVMTVIGTRPEIIRLSRVMSALDNSKAIEHIIVHTGQNYDYELNEIFFKDLGVRKPDYFLNAVGKTTAETIGNIIIKSDEILEKIKPDAVLLYGDTNSCLSVISAKKRQIPIFHMEAGNRCFDQRVPEELNRKIVDHLSDINMPLTEHARDYLIAEGIKPDTIIKTGSCMKEILNFYKKEIDNFKVILSQDTSIITPSFDFINNLSPATYKFIENEKANKIINNSDILDSLIKKFTLQQVTVTSRPEYKLNKLDKIYAFGLFSSGNAYRLNVADDHFFQNSFDLGNYIISQIPGISYSNNFNTMMEFDATPFSWRGSPTSIYLDEIKVSWDVVRDIPRNNIGYIKVFRPIFLGDIQKGTGGAIVIYTKKHFDEPAQFNTKESQLLRGYFSANYFSDEAIKIAEKSRQLNTTLYWEPYFVFYDDPIKDKILRFPNNDFTKRFLIKIEGIDAQGQVLYFEKIIE